MKNSKRIFAAALSGALLVGTLAGCSKAPADPSKTPGPSDAPTVSAPADAPAGSVPLVETSDVVQQLMGFPRDTSMFTVDGVSVPAEQYLYWLGYVIDNVGYYDYQGAENMDWTAEKEGVPMPEYLMNSAKEMAQLYAVMETQAKAAGVTMTAADQKELDSQVQQTIDQLGSTEEYGKYLQQIAMSDAGFRQMYSVNYLYNNLKSKLFGPQGKEKPVDADLIAAAEKDGKLMAKHILIKTVGEDGQTELPAEELAAAKTKAEGILAQLRAAKPKEQADLFDKLMNENSEDGRNQDGSLAAPEGYFFGAGEMVPEFEEGTKALEYNQISDLVKTSYGYHIIMRLAPVSDETRETWAKDKMNTKVDEWMAAAVVTDSADYAKVKPEQFYKDLSALRESLAPKPTATPAPEATPAPTATPAG
ncbi:MAG: peptidylprolyl isomerase [Pseudoflavonifractor sp.]